MDKELYKKLDSYLKDSVLKHHIKFLTKNNCKKNEGYTLIKISYKWLADEIYIKNASDFDKIKNIIDDKIYYLKNIVEGGDYNE